MAATTDWVTLDEGKAAVNITGTTFDTELAMYISAASQRLDLLAGAAVIRTVTDEAHDANGQAVIQLTYRPIVTITTVTQYTGTAAQVLAAETNTAKTAFDYLAVPERGQLRRRASGYDAPFPVGRGNLVVTYTAGRYANTGAVAERFKLAASIYLSHLWRRTQGAGTVTFGGLEIEETGIPTFGVPNAVVDLLANEIGSGSALVA